jgi:hypothetical protein
MRNVGRIFEYLSQFVGHNQPVKNLRQSGHSRAQSWFSSHLL